MLLAALQKLRGKHLANVLWLFTIFYAMTFGIEEGSGSDIVRYMAQVEQLHHVGFTFESAIAYYRESNEVDIIRPLLAILVSRFTDNGNILIIIYGIIFGYFFSRNLSFVIGRFQGRLQLVTIIMLMILFLLNPIWNINGFRFYTAMHVFLYGLLQFLFDGRRKSLIWCVVTPFLFHFSFFTPLVVLCFYLMFGNWLLIYYGFFVFSLFVREINLDMVNAIVEGYVPKVLVDRTAGYRTEEALERFQSLDDVRSWHAVYYQKVLHWSLSLYLIVLFWKSRQIFQLDKRLLSILSFTLLLYGTANILSTLPSGGRFLTLAGMLAVAMLVVYIQNNQQERLMRRLIPMTYPLLGLFLIVSLRAGFYQLSVTTFLGNPLIALFSLGDNIPLNTLIK